MITRMQYLKNEASHNEYYAQFVHAGVKNMVRLYIGESAIRNSTDPHLNDIPLVKWDSLATNLSGVSVKLHECGDYLTLATGVCILKEAARQIKEESK